VLERGRELQRPQQGAALVEDCKVVQHRATAAAAGRLLLLLCKCACRKEQQRVVVGVQANSGRLLEQQKTSRRHARDEMCCIDA
jgi:hypothetical protein